MISPLSDPSRKNLLITGAAGFVGIHLIDRAIAAGYNVVALDILNYAANRRAIEEARLKYGDRFKFIRGSVNDEEKLLKMLQEHKISKVINLAAQTHVGNAIKDARPFIEANITGAYNLGEACRKHWESLPDEEKEAFVLLHTSTDETFGELKSIDDKPFKEDSPKNPRNNYAITKNCGDALLLSLFRMHGLPVIITHFGNLYGPGQHPEKFIPGSIEKALKGMPITIHGNGLHFRDWLQVEDACDGLLLALEKGKAGEEYNLGGECILYNLDVAYAIEKVISEMADEGKIPSRKGVRSYEYSTFGNFIPDRQQNDKGYALDITKARTELGFTPRYTHRNFEEGLRSTIEYSLAQQKNTSITR